MKLFRQRFNVTSPVVSARLYVIALGAYLVHINGHRVGTQMLSTGWMEHADGSVQWVATDDPLTWERPCGSTTVQPGIGIVQ